MPDHPDLAPKVADDGVSFSSRARVQIMSLTASLILIFFIQAEPYIGITPGCAASESGVTSPELLIMFPYGYLERF